MRRINIFHFSTIQFLLLTLAGCGGGGGSTTDTTAPTISSTNPAASATLVARNSAITATFDEDIFATTVDGTSFTLDKLDAVSGAVTFDGVTNVASFMPSSELALLANYTATLSTAITDLSGNALATNYDWSFTTADGAWGEPALLELDNTGSTSSPQIAINGSGNANAVWVQSDSDAIDSIWGNSFNGTTWGTAELLELEDGMASSPQVATDSSGNAVAVWSQRDENGHFNILAASFNGTSWGANAQVIDNAAGKASFPQIAVDRRGNAIAVWHQQAENSVTDIWANRFNGTTWGTAELIEFIPGAAFNPQIAFDENQDAIVVWRQTAGAFDNIYAIRFNALGGTWGQTEVIDREDGDASAPKIAFGVGSGDAIAVWQQSNGNGDSIWANRFNGTTWGTAELIGSEVGNASSPQIAINSNVAAIAVWEQQDGIFKSIWANRSNRNGWFEAKSIETGDAGDAFRPQIAIDSSGNAIAVWHQNDSTRNNLWANRFGTTWGTAKLIETDDSGSATFPQIAIDGSGNGIAVWSQRDGFVASVWANLFK
jgi:hypothetical protein